MSFLKERPGKHAWYWSTKMKGTGIELSNGNLDVWLKESAYMFRTLCGDTVRFSLFDLNYKKGIY